jgi:transcriptional regulator with XRE-family HTH domain
MYKNRAKDGRNNVAGKNIERLRKSFKNKTSQREFAEMLQREGLDVDKNTIQRIESGARFITDIELKVMAEVLNVSCDDLLISQ